MSVIVPLDEKTRRGWVLTLDGETVQSVRLLELENRSFGKITYGLTRGGYDSWSFREAAGGVVLVLYAWVDDVLHVGVVEQLRHNQGGRVLNVPRGFGERGETRSEAAARELSEETGLTAEDVSIAPLPGSPVNPDSAFFETTTTDDGIQFFAGQIPTAQLDRRDDQIVLRAARLAHGAAEEQLSHVFFIPWFQAAALADMFSVAAVGRLLAALVGQDDARLTR
jgi:8-oxo-dGTP pyrophosphatase MutT (NUDIX family)